MQVNIRTQIVQDAINAGINIINLNDWVNDVIKEKVDAMKASKAQKEAQ